MLNLKRSLTIVVVLLPIGLEAQELAAQVNVVTQQLETTEQRIYRSMEKNIQEFLNTTNWTDEDFESRERIQCNIAINITKRNNDQFEAKAQIKSSRPVYKAGYNTTTFDHYDEQFSFKYQPNQRINYQEGAYTSDLSAMLSFYALVIIGIDFDTFEELGGTPYFREAENLVNSAQSSQSSGWSSQGNSKNRYWLINQFRNAQFKPLRKALYTYHRKGLDLMHEQMGEGRKNILKSINLLMKAHDNQPNAFLMDLFFQAKSDEIANIFSKAPASQQKRALNKLETLDPNNLSSYEQKMEP